MGAGRPSKYRPEYCERIIELGREGASLAEMAVACGTTRETLHEWGDRNPEFAEAITHARACALAWWENVGKRAASGELERANAHIWARSMSARFPEDYTETSKVEHLGLPSAKNMGVEDLLAELRNFTAVLGLDRAPLTIEMDNVQDAIPVDRTDTDTAAD